MFRNTGFAHGDQVNPATLSTVRFARRLFNSDNCAALAEVCAPLSAVLLCRVLQVSAYLYECTWPITR